MIRRLPTILMQSVCKLPLNEPTLRYRSRPRCRAKKKKKKEKIAKITKYLGNRRLEISELRYRKIEVDLV